MCELANVSERRLERLVNPQLNGDLPAFLSPEPGLQSGAMIMQYAAASLVSENKTLAHPASVDSITSSANQEDHVSMGTTAARHGYQIIENARRVLAIECVIALQAAELKGVEGLSPKHVVNMRSFEVSCHPLHMTVNFIKILKRLHSI